MGLDQGTLWLLILEMTERDCCQGHLYEGSRSGYIMAAHIRNDRKRLLSRPYLLENFHICVLLENLERFLFHRRFCRMKIDKYSQNDIQLLLSFFNVILNEY